MHTRSQRGPLLSRPALLGRLFPCLAALLFCLPGLRTPVLAQPAAGGAPQGALAAEILAIGDPMPAEARTLGLAEVRQLEGTAPTLGMGEDGLPALETWRGQHGLLVVFAANTCPYVTDWADRFPRLAERGRRDGVGVVVVNSNARKRRASDSPEAMLAFADEHLAGLPYLVDVDSRLATLLGAERTPEALLFDADWRLVYRGQIDDHSGPLAEVSSHYLRDAFGALLGEGIMPESTAPLGCKILGPRRRAPRPAAADDPADPRAKGASP